MAISPVKSDAVPAPEPFIAPDTIMREFTARSVITGTILGVVFGASSLYLVLKVGLTVSASIPVAVIALALFRGLSKLGVRDSTILENNITQTAGSAGESIAFGLGVTMPAILILGFDLEIARVMLVAVLGGLLGILMMIPLRRALIVKEHATLKYPEGTACAAVLKAGSTADDRKHASPSAQAEIKAAIAAGLGTSPGAKVIFGGFAIGLVYKVASVALRLWKDTTGYVFSAPLKGGSVAIEASPELLGVGYIIGPRVGSITAAGGILSYLVLIPLIKFFGDSMTGPVAPGKVLISAMEPDDVRSAYVLYIGAGAVAAGGLISLLRAMPTIWHGIKMGLRDVGIARSDSGAGAALRTEKDLPMKFVGIGVLVLMAAIMMAPSLNMNILGALMIVVFGFLFVTVSSRITGEVGSTSNPISGMTVATLLLTCVIFLAVGWTGGPYYVTALSVGGIVCIASSNGGTTSQDLKTGFLLGSTPKLMQYAILIGAFASALALGPILLILNQTGTVFVPAAEVAPGLTTDVSKLTVRESLTGPQARGHTGSYFVWHKTNDVDGPAGKYLMNDQGAAVWLVDPGINGTVKKRPDGSEVKKFNAPKAVLVSYIIKGILDQKLPWGLVLLGVMIAVVLELCGVPSLVFAVGVYLPISSSAPLFVGGAVRWLVDRYWKKQPGHADLSHEQFVAETDKSPGVLLSSGYIAGGAIAGIVIAILAGVLPDWDTALNNWADANNPFFSSKWWLEGAAAGARDWSDALALIPFATLILFLYFVARGKLLAPKPTA
jgi:putative OPT family oligopeptide transporter